jgi:hypothetical protein
MFSLIKGLIRRTFETRKPKKNSLDSVPQNLNKPIKSNSEGDTPYSTKKNNPSPNISEIARDVRYGNTSGIYEANLPLDKKIGILYDMILNGSSLQNMKEVQENLRKISQRNLNSIQRKDIFTLESLIGMRLQYEKEEKVREEEIIEEEIREKRAGDMQSLEEIPKIDYKKIAFKSYLLNDLLLERKMSQLKQGDNGKLVGRNEGEKEPYITSQGVIHTDSLRKYCSVREEDKTLWEKLVA